MEAAILDFITRQAGEFSACIVQPQSFAEYLEPNRAMISFLCLECMGRTAWVGRLLFSSGSMTASVAHTRRCSLTTVKKPRRTRARRRKAIFTAAIACCARLTRVSTIYPRQAVSTEHRKIFVPLHDRGMKHPSPQRSQRRTPFDCLNLRRIS